MVNEYVVAPLAYFQFTLLAYFRLRLNVVKI